MSKDDFIPAGFVPLANWDYRSRGKADGHSPDYKELRVAVDAGKVPAIRVGGSNRWYVREADAIAFLKASSPEPIAAKAKTGSLSDLQHESVCESMADIAQSAAGIERLLERLATAVESIATAPKHTHDEPVGSWRDMNGEAL